MGGQRLIHDCSWACAVSIVECIENCLRPEERKDALHEIYERVKAAMERYEQMMKREAFRLCDRTSTN
jgi:hypothetical protein